MKTYPLTPAQQVIILVITWSKGKSHIMNIPTSLLVGDELDFDLLKEAIAIEIERNDALRIRLLKEDGKIVQHFQEKEANFKVEMLDFTGKTEQFQEAALLKLASKGFKHFKEPLYRFYMVKSYDGTQGVFFNGHHIIMDSYAIMAMYKDLFDVYYAMKNGRELPKPLTKFEDVLQKDLAYLESEKYQEDKEFFTQMFQKPEPMYTSIDGSHILEHYRKKKPDTRAAFTPIVNFVFTKSKHKVIHIDHETTARFMDFCAQTQTPFQVFYIMGIRTYLAIRNKREKDVTVTATVARRATLMEKRCGGTRTHFFPLRTVMEEDVKVMDAIEMIRDEQSDCFRHVNFPSQLHMEMNKESYGVKNGTYSDMQFTYQPLALGVEAEGVQLFTKWYNKGDGLQRLYLTIMHNLSENGGMDAYFEYLSKFHTEESVERFQRGTLTILDAIIEDKDMTLGQLMDKCSDV